MACLKHQWGQWGCLISLTCKTVQSSTLLLLWNVANTSGCLVGVSNPIISWGGTTYTNLSNYLLPKQIKFPRRLQPSANADVQNISNLRSSFNTQYNEALMWLPLFINQNSCISFIITQLCLTLALAGILVTACQGRF